MAQIIEKVSQENKPSEINEITTNFKNAHLEIPSSQNKSELNHKSTFMVEFEQSISIEESRKRVHAKIDGLWSK